MASERCACGCHSYPYKGKKPECYCCDAGHAPAPREAGAMCPVCGYEGGECLPGTKDHAEIAALRAEVERLTNDLADALDLKNGVGPTVMTALATARDAEKARADRAEARVRRLEALLREAQEERQGPDELYGLDHCYYVPGACDGSCLPCRIAAALKRDNPTTTAPEGAKERTMTPEQKLAAIAAIVSDITPSSAAATAPGPGVGEPPPATKPWWRDPLPETPTTPITNLSDEEGLKKYAATGVKADCKRGVAEQDFPRALGMADEIAAAKSPQEADAVVMGAGHFSPDTAIYLVLTGAVQGTGLGQAPSIFAPWGKWDSISAAAAYVTNQPIVGPGPSGQ